MSFHKFAIPATPSTSQRAVSVAQLVKSKWTLPSTSSSSGVTKNVTINGKTIPLKVLSVISQNKATTASTVPRASPALNARVQPTFKCSSKNASSTKRHGDRDAFLSSDDSDGDQVSTDSENISFPTNEEGDVYIMEKLLTHRYMKSLVRFLRRQLVGRENIILQLLEALYTPKCISKFNVTGKKKKRFKSLKINQVLMHIAKLKEKDYWQQLASAIHVMERRHARELAKAN